MDRVGVIAENLRDVLKPMVAMIVAQVSPKEDYLSKNKAYELYGRRWIDGHIRRGNLNVRYVGSSRQLSKVDIELLIAAEKERPSIL
jgi:hypothetical protein